MHVRTFTDLRVRVAPRAFFGRDICRHAHGGAPIRRKALVCRAAASVLVPIANGSEEIEAVCIIDVLRRAGAEVTVASVEDTAEVVCSRGVRLVADTLISQLPSGPDSRYDAIALPGGMPGAERLSKSDVLQSLLSAQQADQRWLAAICAAPAVVLQTAGYLTGRKATSHPAFVDKLSDTSAAEQRVVLDGNILTSRGPGTALEFSLALVQLLYGEAKAREVAGPMVMFGKYTHV